MRALCLVLSLPCMAACGAPRGAAGGIHADAGPAEPAPMADSGLDAGRVAASLDDAKVPMDRGMEFAPDAGMACPVDFVDGCMGHVARSCSMEGLLVQTDCATSLNPLCWVTPFNRPTCVAAMGCDAGLEACPDMGDSIPWIKSCNRIGDVTVTQYGQCGVGASGPLVCAPDEMTGRGNCVSAERCEPEGRTCQGNQLLDCHSGRATRHDCAARGEVCVDEGAGVFCVDPTIPRCDPEDFVPRCEPDGSAVRCSLVFHREQTVMCGMPSHCCIDDGDSEMPCCI